MVPNHGDLFVAPCLSSETGLLDAIAGAAPVISADSAP